MRYAARHDAGARLSRTNAIGISPPPTGAASADAARGALAAARTVAAPLSPWSADSAFAEIAGNTAKVSLAGAMISQATTGSDVRFEKVAALRQAIAAGTYNVSAADLADKLIGTMQK